MTKSAVLGFFLVWLVLCAPPPAAAADGSPCTDDNAHYKPELGQCFILADGRGEPGGTTASSAPFNIHDVAKLFGSARFAYGKCPLNCEPGTARLYESDSPVDGSPNVWHELAVITGCGSAFVSGDNVPSFTKAWVRVAWDADITDTDCPAGSVDATVTALP